MHDPEQIPRLGELLYDMPRKYILLLVLLGIIAAATLFWLVAIL